MITMKVRRRARRPKRGSAAPGRVARCFDCLETRVPDLRRGSAAPGRVAG